MTDSAIIHFPQEEVEDRVKYVLSVLPALGRNMLSYQESISSTPTESAEADYRLMKKAETHIEDLLIQAIRSRFDNDWIYAEERDHLEGESEFAWWIDPLDGTRNFIHGVPLFSNAIGICFRDEPVAGVVQVPALGEIYYAIYGGGSYKNDRPIRVSGLEEVERSLIATGLPYNRKQIINELMTNIAAFVSSGTGLRRSGSAVLDLCWVAEGRFEAYWERALSPHDLCAASVILREAGGKLTGFQGEPFQMHMGDVLASNSILHPRLLNILSEARRIEGMN
ncbi:MAG: inositol monophosphatase [Leptospiraceae bacterium]|nr:inositol monophosphatase [Leptospiraceae bacterium]MCB1316174.1 inositol monophosphatase [Leptospiraceae bacterium]